MSEQNEQEKTAAQKAMDIARKEQERINQNKKSEQDKSGEKPENADEKKAESKGAAPESSTEKEKTEESQQSLAEKAEAQAKEDERILGSDNKDLDIEELKRKKDLLDRQSKKSKVSDNVQRRIDELVGEIKELKNARVQDREAIERLQKEKDELEKRMTQDKQPSKDDVLKKIETDRLAKYIEEDKGKPRDQRREMSKDELEEWMLEDMVSAQEWITERTVRRHSEKQRDADNLTVDEKTKAIAAKQAESFLRVVEKHPDLNTQQKASELLRSGKTAVEVHKQFLSENDKYRMFNEILDKHPEFILKENGPELVMAEMEKIITAKAPQKEEENELLRLRKLTDELESELKRRESVDSGISSRSKFAEAKEKKSELELKQLELAKRAGISPERLKEVINRRKTIPGADLRDSE